MPPIRPGYHGNSPDRSPYSTDTMSLVDFFATSPERIHILDGLLRFRSELYQAGITSGFQWVDGSYLENIEVLENRPPNDMDIVTFTDFTGLDQQALITNHPTLFIPNKAKEIYSIDAYYVELGNQLEQESVRLVSYWYSMWSHRRNGVWKGFLQIKLDSANDACARTLLNELQRSPS